MTKFFLIMALLSNLAWGQSKSDTFIVEMMDRKVKVISPEKVKSTFIVIVENRSLSNLVAKFSTEAGALKYVSIESGKAETVEIIHRSGNKIYFVPLSPAFQEIELVAGKKEYEIPSQK